CSGPLRHARQKNKAARDRPKALPAAVETIRAAVRSAQRRSVSARASAPSMAKTGRTPSTKTPAAIERQKHQLRLPEKKCCHAGRCRREAASQFAFVLSFAARLAARSAASDPSGGRNNRAAARSVRAALPTGCEPPGATRLLPARESCATPTETSGRH